MSDKIDNENNYGLVVGNNKGSINNYGMSYSDVKEICTDLVRNELNNYSIKSKEVINARLEEFENDLIEVIKVEANKNPNILEAFKDPSVQSDIFEAEKSFIKKGTDDLKEILLRVLNQRIINFKSGNELLDIVLGESVKTAAILTPIQYKILSLCFILKHTIWLNVNNKISFEARIKKDLLPLFGGLKTKESDFQHLEFTSCGQISIGSTDLINWFKQYEGLFSIGFDSSDLASINSINGISSFIQACINDNAKFQFKALNEKQVEDFCNDNSIINSDRDKILKLYKKSMPSDLKKELLSFIPELDELFVFWDKSKIRNLQLTSVGIVIGAEYIDPTGKSYDLTIWI